MLTKNSKKPLKPAKKASKPKTAEKPAKKASKPGKKPGSAKALAGKKLPSKLVSYLESAGVKHDFLEHKTVYTAIDAAATMKKKLGEIVKSLLVKADKDYYLVLLPADYNLDFKKLGKCIGMQTGKPVKTIKIPGEKIMEELLKIKAGAMGAFGGVHKLPVVMEKSLAKNKKAVFSSGSFNHSIEMLVKDFIKLENAVLGQFGVKKKVKFQAAAKPKRKIKNKK